MTTQLGLWAILSISSMETWSTLLYTYRQSRYTLGRGITFISDRHRMEKITSAVINISQKVSILTIFFSTVKKSLLFSCPEKAKWQSYPTRYWDNSSLLIVRDGIDELFNCRARKCILTIFFFHYPNKPK